jgi:filamentous hemagglutinin
MVNQAGGAWNLTDDQRTLIVGASTLLGGLTAGLAGQNAQGGAAAAENEALNNGTQDHRSAEQKEADALKEQLSKERAMLDNGGNVIVGYDEEGNAITVRQPAAPLGGGGANATAQNPLQRGIQFQGDALSALGVPENTQRFTVTLPGGSPVTVVPDALDGSTIIEVKDVTNLSNSNQFRGYLATGKPIELIVSPNTQRISQPLQNLITSSGGSIRVFNPSTGALSPWMPK